MGRWIALVLLLSSLQASRADVVTLRCGVELEGAVLEREGGKLEVRSPLGGTVVERSEVVSIAWGPTREERYQAELGRTDPFDPEALVRLAAWCQREGFGERARRWRSEAARLSGQPEPAQARWRPNRQARAPRGEWPATRVESEAAAPRAVCAPAAPVVQQVVVVQVVERARSRRDCERPPIRAASRGRAFGPQLRWPD